jgi:hypothetical protein
MSTRAGDHFEANISAGQSYVVAVLYEQFARGHVVNVHARGEISVPAVHNLVEPAEQLMLGFSPDSPMILVV